MTARFTTQGGPGSIHADLGSLEAVAVRHDEAGEQLVRLSVQMPAMCGQLQPAARVSGAAAVLTERLVRSGEDLRAGGERLRENTRDLHTAVRRYADAERAASEVVVDADVPMLDDLPAALDERAQDGLDVAEAEFLVRAGIRGADEKAASMFLSGRLGALVEAVPLQPWQDGWKQKEGKPLSDRAKAVKKGRSQALGGVLGEGVEGLVHALGRIPGAPRATPRGVWGGLGAVAAIDGHLSRLVVAGVSDATPRAPQRLTGRLTELGELIPRASEGEGAVIVTEVRRADGGTTWIAALPGTQGGILDLAPTDDWADVAGNAEALGLGSPMVATGVARALEAAGAPSGADVALVGYSQGGIHAVNLAADEGFAARYRVRGVMTIGSPNGDRVAPADVPVLEFAADTDLYTAADGGRNPVGPHRATVLFQDDAPALLAPGTASRQAWDAVPGTPPGVPAFVEPASRTVGAIGPIGREMDQIHDLERYMERIKDFEDAPAAERAEVEGLQRELAGVTAGTVVASRVVRLKRGRLSAQHRQCEPGDPPSLVTASDRSRGTLPTVRGR